MDALARKKQALQLLAWTYDHYTPSAAQAAFHKHQARLKLVAGGVRAGKSRSTAAEFYGELAVTDGLLWIVGPDYEQCKPEFKYIYETFRAMGFVASASRPERGSQSMVLINGCRIQTKSSDDAEALASFAPNAILMVEAGQQRWDIYQKVLERALEHNAKVILSGTFEGSLSWYAELFERWQGANPEGGASFSIPSWTNTKIFPLGRQDPKILALEAAMPEELFAERVGAVPYKPQGLVFKKFGAKHIGRFPYNPAWPVELAIDPAQHTYAVEAIQWQGERVRVIDEIYMHQVIAQDIIPVVMERPWWPNVAQNAGVIDIAGKQHQGNHSQIEIWLDMAGKSLRSNYVYIDEGISAMRLRLEKLDDDGDPLLMFDEHLRNTKGFDGRADGVRAEMNLFKWRDWKEGRNNSPKPIDANNDACKAIWYWLFDKYGPVVLRKSAQMQSVQRPYWN